VFVYTLRHKINAFGKSAVPKYPNKM